MRPALVHTLLAILGGFVVWMIVPPGRANADPVPIYCGLGYTQQSCAEFPIETHWVADATGGGTEQLGGTHADPRRLTEPELRYGHYSGMTTDTYAPADWEVIRFIELVENALGCNPIPPDPAAPTCVPLKLYNYDSETALGKLQENSPYIQIIHNVRIPLPEIKSLFTFIFPPGWQRTRSYPILLSGNGGFWPNNQTLFLTDQARLLAARVGQSGSAATPLIAALSNTGGREGQGWHRTGLDDVARMLGFMQLNGYGVDPSRVVNLGFSRGGGTALLWGENPLDPFSSNYTSIGVFAMEPPSHGGFISQ